MTRLSIDEYIQLLKLKFNLYFKYKFCAGNLAHEILAIKIRKEKIKCIRVRNVTFFEIAN